MRILVAGLAAAAAASCGGHPSKSSTPPPPPIVAEYAALRWVPDHPTYIFTAHSAREIAAAIHGVAPNVSADLLKQIGVDPDGSFAIFSEGLSPTVVVHLSDPEVVRKLASGVGGTPSTVDGVTLTTTQLHGHDVTWAIEGDWMFVHGHHGGDNDADWFTHSHHPSDANRMDAFGWAKHMSDELKLPGVVGWFDAHNLVKHMLDIAPKKVLACVQLLEPISRVAVALSGDDHHLAGRVAVELGGSAKSVAGALLPPPPGFPALVRTAPISAQWNLDVDAFMTWFAPCAAATGADMTNATKFGVRSARVALESLDPEKKAGTGVASIDLKSSKFITDQLDQIPQRSMFESKRTFGSYQGHHLAIPFVATVDYVLDDHAAMISMGDGMMEKLVAGTPTAGAPPLFSLDIQPPAMKPEIWQWLIAQGAEGDAPDIVAQLMKWQAGHIALSIDGDSLVFDAAANR